MNVYQVEKSPFSFLDLTMITYIYQTEDKRQKTRKLPSQLSREEEEGRVFQLLSNEKAHNRQKRRTRYTRFQNQTKSRERKEQNQSVRFQVGQFDSERFFGAGCFWTLI